jgi:SOS response regulatory protein OraA/RecX
LSIEELPVVIQLEKGARAGWQRVALSDGSFFCVLQQLLHKKGWDQPGTALTAEEGMQLQRTSWQLYARQRAMTALARSEQSRHTLQIKLLQRDCPAQIVRELLDELEESGALSDSRYADLWARNRFQRKGEGPKKVIVGLRQRGISAECARAAVELLLEEEPDFLNSALQTAIRRLRKKGKSEQAISAALMQEGFPSDLILEYLN